MEQTSVDKVLEVMRLAIVANVATMRLSLEEVKYIYFEIWRLRTKCGEGTDGGKAKGENDERSND